jgi:hypothetical protein
MSRPVKGSGHENPTSTQILRREEQGVQEIGETIDRVLATDP